MKNNEKLFHEIGELDERIVPAIVKEGNKKTPLKWTAAGVAAAAAVTGFVITQALAPAVDPWEDYRIFPASDYKNTIVIDEQPKLSYTISNRGIYWEDEHEAMDWLYPVSDISELEDNNPWNEELELTSLPVFKSRVEYADYPGVPGCLTEAELTQMLDNTAKALGVTIRQSDFEYYDDAEFPDWLSADCDGGDYGVDSIGITVYGYGYIHIWLGTELPEEYTLADADSEQTAKTAAYLADRFKNLLQYKNPTVSIKQSQYSALAFDRDNKIFDSSDDIVQNILNYNLAYTTFGIVDDRVSSVTLTDFRCISDYVGDYPIISLDQAKELLLNGSYLKIFPDSFFKDGKLKEEDVKKAELIYLNEEYTAPYYRFYVELEPLASMEGSGQTLYGDVYVPAVAPEYLKAADYYSAAQSPDFNNEAMGAYPAENVTFPDGSILPKTDAAKTYGNAQEPYLEYNFAFLRYAKPVFQSTLDDPDCYDFDDYRFAEKIDVNITDPDYFKVQKGDVLENGLTVKSAYYKVGWRDGKQVFVESNVILDGEITCEGILMCRLHDPSVPDSYDLVFYPDPTGDTPMMSFCSSKEDNRELLQEMVFDEIAFRLDGDAIFLDSAFEFVAEAEGFADIYGTGKGVKARLTLENITYTVDENRVWTTGHRLETEILR